MKQLLKNIAEVSAGQGAPQGDSNYCEDGIPFVKAGNLLELTEGVSIFDIQKVSQEVAQKHRLKLYKKGSVLFAKSGMSCLKGYVYVLPCDAYVVSHLACITPKDDISDYLKYYFYYHKPNQFVKDEAYPSISLSDIGNLEIDLKDAEQRRIAVASLNEISLIIDARQQELQKLNELVKARFVEMFGNAENGESKYPLALLGNLAAKISDGVHAKPEYTESGRPFLSVVNINQKKVDFTDCKYVSEEAYQKMIKSTYPEKGDVLYTKVGATYGIPAYVDTDTEFCLYVSVCLIKPDHNKINSRFLAIQMDTPFVKHQADKRIKGIGVPDLHLNQIKEFQIVCPPRQLQDEFVEFVKQIDKSKFIVQQALDKAQALFDGLMQKYFG